MLNALVTGGAGFIGSHLVKRLIKEGAKVTVLDKLTYCGNMDNLKSIEPNSRFRFIKGDICDSNLLQTIFKDEEFNIIYHLAAESHVDRSISKPADFLATNIDGTYNLLQSSLDYFKSLNDEKKKLFKFIHVSTDEVFGELGETGYFTEKSPYKPNSPYSASKAASDHLARAWNTTYGLPTIITNCSNNYGPNQYPEKLIPLAILNATSGKNIGIYGDGKNVRDWIYVEDHCEGLLRAGLKGKAGYTYLFGGNAEKTNNEVIEVLCQELDSRFPTIEHSKLVRYIEDRKGHDFRYAIDDTETVRQLGLYRSHSFEDGMSKTINWYLDNDAWIKRAIEQRQEY